MILSLAKLCIRHQDSLFGFRGTEGTASTTVANIPTRPSSLPPEWGDGACAPPLTFY